MNKAIAEKLEHNKRLDIGEIKEILDTEETYEVPINGEEIEEILAYFRHNGKWYRITYATCQHAEVIRGQKAEEVTEQQFRSVMGNYCLGFFKTLLKRQEQ